MWEKTLQMSWGQYNAHNKSSPMLIEFVSFNGPVSGKRERRIVVTRDQHYHRQTNLVRLFFFLAHTKPECG